MDCFMISKNIRGGGYRSAFLIALILFVLYLVPSISVPSPSYGDTSNLASDSTVYEEKRHRIDSNESPHMRQGGRHDSHAGCPYVADKESRRYRRHDIFHIVIGYVR